MARVSYDPEGDVKLRRERGGLDAELSRICRREEARARKSWNVLSSPDAPLPPGRQASAPRDEQAAALALIHDAVRAGQQQIAAAHAAARKRIAAARIEAQALLATLPDFAALEAAPAKRGKSAGRAMREAADRRGVPVAAIISASKSPVARLARLEAVLGVVDACPGLSREQLGKLFKRSGETFSRLYREALEARRRGEI